jgi:hypothetical protein
MQYANEGGTVGIAKVKKKNKIVFPTIGEFGAGHPHKQKVSGEGGVVLRVKR